MPNPTRTRRARIVISSAVLLLTRLLVTAGGYVAMILMAARFGLEKETDAFFVARLIPVTFMGAIGMAFNLSFLPVYMELKAKAGEEQARKLAANFLNLTVLASFLISALYFLFAPQIIGLMAPGFPEPALRLAVSLTRVMAFIMVTANLYAVFDSILNSERRFVLSSLGTLWVPAGNLIGVLLLADSFGMTGVAIGVFGGFLAQTLHVLPLMPRYLHPYRPKVDFADPHLRGAMQQLVFAIFTFASLQLITAVERMLGSYLGAGAVSALSIGFVFVGLFPVLIGLPVYKVLYPELSRLVHEGRKADLCRLFSSNFLFVAAITFPVTMAFWWFPEEITRLAFLSGKFDPSALFQTAQVIKYFSLGLPPSIAVILVTYYFFVIRESRVVVFIMVLMIVLNTGLDYLLMKTSGLEGIALGRSLVAFVRLVLFWLALTRAIGGPGLAKLLVPLLKIGLATLVTGVFFKLLITAWPQGPTAGSYLRHLFLWTAFLGLGGVLYILASLALRSEQLLAFLALFRRKRGPAAGSAPTADRLP